MCKFFSLVSNGDGEPIYCDWNIRKQVLEGKIEMESPDSHTSIATHFGYKGEKEDKLNKYEYNPLTKVFVVDQLNTTDDKCLIEKWVRHVNFKTIVPHLSLGVIKNPLETKAKKVSKKDLQLLKEWASVGDSVWDSVGDRVWASVRDRVWASVRASVRDSVWASVRASVGDSVWASVRDSVGDSVWASVWASVGASVGDSVWDSVWAYTSSFFTLDKWKYTKHEKGVNPFQSCIDLYKRGLVPSFDGKLWRLHSGKKAKIVWQGTVEDLNKLTNPRSGE